MQMDDGILIKENLKKQLGDRQKQNDWQRTDLTEVGARSHKLIKIVKSLPFTDKTFAKNRFTSAPPSKTWAIMGYDHSSLHYWSCSTGWGCQY